MIILKVMVQLPDGSFQRCPIVRDETSSRAGQIVRHDNMRAAHDWGRFVLPGRIEYVEEEDK